MLNPYFNQLNYIPLETSIFWKTQGYSSMGMDVTGTFTSGSFVLQGSNDGTTWTTLETANSSGIISGGTISATGHYVFNVLGFNIVKYVPTSVNGTLVLSSLITVEVAGIFIEGGGGLNPVVDSLTITGVDNAALATDENGLVYGVTGVSGDVMRLSGTGSGSLWSVAWTGTHFVAVGDGGAIYTSTTGTGTWTRRTDPSTAIMLSVAWNGTYLTAVGVGGATITSTDGITWTLRTNSTANNLNSITWDATNSQWVAVGSTQTVVTSPDAVTWTTRTYGTTTAIRGVAAGTSIIVSVAQSGVIKTSPTGVTWTTRTSGVATELYGVTWDATNARFVVVGASGVILTSPDGTTWTARTSGVSTFLRAVAVTPTGSAYTVVGDGGVILGSTNSTAWTVKTSGTTSNLASVVNNGSLWVAVGATGLRLTSADGDTWATVAQQVWTASTPTGTGSLVTEAGASTFTGSRVFTDPTAIGGVFEPTIEPEGGGILQVIKTAISAALNNSSIQMISYATGSVLHFINGEGTESAPAVAAQGSTSSIGWRFLTNVGSVIKAHASSAAIIVTKTGTDTTVAVPAADMSLQIADGSGSRLQALYASVENTVGIGSYYTNSTRPVAQLSVRSNRSEQVNLFGNAATGDNYALDVNQVGVGATSNTGIYLNVLNATANTAIEIHSPNAGASNYAIKSTATAQSVFSGSMDATAYKVAGVAGASGSFLSADAKTVTVVNGIITSIV